MLIGVPVSFGIALFLTEMCPAWLRRPLGTAVELLAAIPSIIYGMWGLFVFAPLFADHVQPLLTTRIGQLPIIGPLFQGPPIGIGMLTAGIVLAIMVIPFIASVMRDVFEMVPPVLKESAYGLGATTWEVVRNIVLPYTRIGVVGGIMLGLGRALGETMAVTFVIGNAYQISAVAVRARQLDRLDARQRIHRGGRPDPPRVADRARPGAVRDHLHRARPVAHAARQLARARASRPEGRHDHDARAIAPAHRDLPLYRTALRQPLQPDRVDGRDGLRPVLPAAGSCRPCSQRLPGAEPALFTQMTPPPGSEGGLPTRSSAACDRRRRHADRTPIGILAGIYLAEFGKNGWVARLTRFINDILLSAPSIVIGLFVYTVYVAQVEHFSGWAGSFALALIAIPVVVRTTENMLRLVPASLREAAVALGAPQWKVILMVTLRAVRGGVVTGILLAVARISGETAPLLFTALNNQFWSTDMNAPMANLPVVIFQFAMSPYEDWSRWPGRARC